MKNKRTHEYFGTNRSSCLRPHREIIQGRDRLSFTKFRTRGISQHNRFAPRKEFSMHTNNPKFHRITVLEGSTQRPLKEAPRTLPLAPAYFFPPLHQKLICGNYPKAFVCTKGYHYPLSRQRNACTTRQK